MDRKTVRDVLDWYKQTHPKGVPADVVEVVMSEENGEEWDGYIKKSDAIWGIERLKYLGKEPKHTFYNSAILDANNVIASLPEAIVRCKDCRFHEDEEIGMVYCPTVVGGWVEDNWFCKGGEREDD